MFDWNEDGEVKDTIWGEFRESEDHIVPYPKGIEELTFGDYCKKRRFEQGSRDVRSTDQKTSGANNDLSGCNLQNNSHVSTNAEFSAPRFDLDSWPDLPYLNASLSKGFSDRGDQDHMASELVNNFSTAPDLDPVMDNMITKICHADAQHDNDSSSLKESCSFSTGGTAQLDSEPDMFGNEHGDKEGDNFLDCDWANIADFVDLDTIFRSNDFTFGHEMIDNADELLSPPTDAISNTTPSFPMPVDEQSEGKIKPLQEDKTTDYSVAAGEQEGCQSQLTCENCGSQGQFSSKMDRGKKSLKSRTKTEEMGMEKSSQSLSNCWSHNTNQVQQFESQKMHVPVPSALYRQREIGGCESMGYFHTLNPHTLTGYGYPLQPFPVVPLNPPVHAERKYHQPVATGYKVHSDPPKHTYSSKKLPDGLSRPMNMTPQEKVEKLRRRHQMQAMLAIQQQQQQFGHQIIGSDISASQRSSHMNQSQDAAVNTIAVQESAKGFTSSELNMPVEQDDLHKISMSIDDYSLRETMLHQLQDVIEKLDISIRLCIRDSLFRLARSAMERHCASDRSSANKSSGNEDEVLVNKETNNPDRATKLPDVETDTNPIDRTVAHFLFHRPSESCKMPIKDEIPESPLSSNPASKQSDICESVSEDKPENVKDMEVQASI